MVPWPAGAWIELVIPPLREFNGFYAVLLTVGIMWIKLAIVIHIKERQDGEDNTNDFG